MSTLTIKKFPEPLLAELKKKAGAARPDLRGEFLLREADTEQDADGRGSARWRDDQGLDRLV